MKDEFDRKEARHNEKQRVRVEVERAKRRWAAEGYRPTRHLGLASGAGDVDVLRSFVDLEYSSTRTLGAILAERDCWELWSWLRSRNVTEHNRNLRMRPL